MWLPASCKCCLSPTSARGRKEPLPAAQQRCDHRYRHLFNLAVPPAPTDPSPQNGDYLAIAFPAGRGGGGRKALFLLSELAEAVTSPQTLPLAKLLVFPSRLPRQELDVGCMAWGQQGPPGRGCQLRSDDGCALPVHGAQEALPPRAATNCQMVQTLLYY